MPVTRSLLCCFAVVLLVSGPGCGSDGPELAPVEGTVRLDGQPLEGALLTFTPTEGGRPAMGRTDADGWYELIYTADRNGALPGDHIVSISTYVGDDSDAGVKGVAEKVPAKYNVKSTLTKTVSNDDNVIDFDLKSDGKIITPPKGGGY